LEHAKDRFLLNAYGLLLDAVMRRIAGVQSDIADIIATDAAPTRSGT
jgi:hypothetical protein